MIVIKAVLDEVSGQFKPETSFPDTAVLVVMDGTNYTIYET